MIALYCRHLLILRIQIWRGGKWEGSGRKWQRGNSKQNTVCEKNIFSILKKDKDFLNTCT